MDKSNTANAEKGNTANTKAGRWTSDEDYSLLVQVSQQVVGKGYLIKFEDITVPGRSERALKEHLGKIVSDVTAVGLSTQGAPGAPQVRAPRTPAAGKAAGKVTKAKRGPKMISTPVTGRRRSTPRKRKLEKDSDDENSEAGMSNVKSDSDDDSVAKDSEIDEDEE